MEAFFRQHSGVVREQGSSEAAELPVDVPEGLRAALLGLPHLGERSFRRVLRTLRGPVDLFVGLDAAGLAALRALLDFYCFPLPWVAWVAQEQFVRSAAVAAPVEQLPPFVTDALLELRTVLLRVRRYRANPTPAVLWAAVMAGGDDDLSYAVELALGYRAPLRAPEQAGLPCRVLAAIGDVEGLQWARAAGFPWSGTMNDEFETCHYSTCALAAAGGHLATLQWLAGQAGARPTDDEASLHAPQLYGDACWSAAAFGHRDVLEWLLGVGCPVGDATFVEAAVRWGDAALLRRLLSAGCAVTVDTIKAAAGHGCVLAIQVAREAGCAWGSRACSAAARHGHLTTLQWLRAEGCPWNTAEVWYAAATGGHLAMLQWLMAQGCGAMNGYTFHEAVESGDLATLQWLCAEGCPWSVDACKTTAEKGRLAVLEWLVGAGCPWDARECCEAAVVKGHIDIVRWVLNRGCPPLSPDMCWFATIHSLACLQLLVGAGSPWDKSECWGVAHRRGDTAAADWVMAQIPWWQRGWTRFWSS